MSRRVLQLALAFGLGVALTLVAVQYLYAYFEERRIDLAQVQLRYSGHNRDMQKFLREPWFPGSNLEQPDRWQLRRLDGSRFTLADLKGKAVFLNFWSTTCAPCLAEMPEIEKLAQSMSAEPVVFLAVSPEEPAKVRKFVDQNKINVPLATITGLPENVGIGYPTTYFIDPHGTMTLRLMGAYRWDSDSTRAYLTSLLRH
ncbi:MAG TPA: TlpA disulfide reductase family protein [Terriglobales bacterium]|nr:TlpA disulfide reductase family protein [Terriglobales bacterium]